MPALIGLNQFDAGIAADSARGQRADFIAERFGGWPRFCCVHPDEIKWVRKDFVKAYCSYARTGHRGYAHLPGIAENENILGGIEYKEAPALVGQNNQLAIAGG
jgi:hypothetical protein